MQILYKILSKKNLSLLNPITAKNSLNLLKTGQISIQNGIIVYKGDKIRWEDFKKKFKKGQIHEDLLRAIGGLRKCTIIYLFEKLKINPKKCYAEIGSDTPTSDLDFTFVAYSKPESMVSLLINFNQDFYSLYGNFSDITFDTNFYVIHMIVDKSCFVSVKPQIRPLFRSLMKGKYYALDNFKDKRIQEFDRKVCFQVQKFQKKLMSSRHSKNYKLENMIDYLIVFYDMMSSFSSSTYFNEKLLLLRSLSYIVCAFSNEAYVSDITLRTILYKIPLKIEEERCIAFVDQYLFIYEWFHMFANRQKDLLEFFDVISKYIYRAGICLNGSPLAKMIPASILKFSEYWKENIRGKISMEDAKSLDISYEISNEIKTVSHLFTIFEKIFRKIDRKMSDKHAEKYFKELLARKNIHTKVLNGTILVT